MNRYDAQTACDSAKPREALQRTRLAELTFKSNPPAKKLGLKSETMAEQYGQGATFIADAFDARVSGAKAIDRDKLEKVLRVKERKALREEIRKLTKGRVEWLEGKHRGSPVQAADGFIPFTTAIIDHFSLASGEYHQAWECLTDICAHFGDDPGDLDAMLTLPQDRQRQQGDENPGRCCLQSLLDSGHPLHCMIFPTEAQCPVASDAAPQAALVPIDGSGCFRPHALDPQGFAAVTHTDLADIAKVESLDVPGPTSLDIGQTWRRVAEQTDGALTYFTGLYMKPWNDWQKQLQEARVSSQEAAQEAGAAAQRTATARKAAVDTNKITERMRVLTRGLKATNLQAYSQLRLVRLKDLPVDHVVLGLKVLDKHGPLPYKEMRQAVGEHNRAPVPEDTLANSRGQPLASTNPKRVNIQGSGAAWSKNVHMQALEVVSLPRDVAVALKLDHYDLHKADAAVDLAQAREEVKVAETARNDATVQAYRQSEAELELKRQALRQREAEVARIEAQERGATASKLKSERWANVGKGVKGVVVMFNAWNTVGAYRALSGDDSKQKQFEFVSAGMDLLYAFGDFTNALVKEESRVGKFFKANISRTKINLFKGFGAGAAAMSCGLAVIASIQEANSGDRDAAVAQGVMAVGFGLLTLSLLGEAGVASLAMFTGPVGWIALGIVLLGAAMYMLFNDTDLERWAKNGPFAKGDARDPDLAYLGAEAIKDGITGKVDSLPAFEFLMGALFTPTLTVEIPNKHGLPSTSNPRLVARLGLPLPFPHAEGEIEADLVRTEHRSRPFPGHPGRYLPAGHGLNKVETRQVLPQRTAAEDEQQVSSDQDGRLTRNYYFEGIPSPFQYDTAAWRYVAKDKDLLSASHLYRFKARLKIGNMVFPVIPRDAQGQRTYEVPNGESQHADGIDLKTPGWIYATAIFVARGTQANWYPPKCNIIPEPPAPKKP